jgi:ribosomal protein S18 acetylase RimI-like enzyme
VAAGLADEAEAAAYADTAFIALLPDGLATVSHHLWDARGPDGARVGQLWVRVRSTAAEVEGYLFDIEIPPELRGRGWGRAVMLAAESAARGMGATVMRLNVFSHNEPAVGLYTGLGYAVADATLIRRLVGTSAPVSRSRAVELRDMTRQEYVDLRSSRPPAGDREGPFPEASASSGHRLWTAVDGDRPVGRVCLQLQHRSDGVHAMVHHLDVPRGLRGRGYGGAILLAVERSCRELDVRTVAVTVPGSDSGALRLVQQRGFELTAQTREKQLRPSPGSPDGWHTSRAP